MNDFQKEFVMGFFMDDDSSIVNKSVMALTDILLENVDNLNVFNEATSIEKPCEISDKALDPSPIIKDYYEQLVVNFSEEDYQTTFRAKRTTVQSLINFLKTVVPHGNVSLDKKVHVFLMFLICDKSYNEIGKLFGLHKSTVSHIFQEISSHLTENHYSYITWPSAEEQHDTRIKINSKFKFPNCIGFIDACRLNVGQRTTRHSTILLQAVCDESLMFVDIHIGEMGKTKKNKVFKDSPLARKLQNMIDFDNHILGDAEYRLKMNLMTPYTSEELLTSEEMKYNDVHWKARSYIGHAFELLKEKFRKLSHIDILKPELINTFIYSACVLHNFILMHEGCTEIKEEAVICDQGVTLNSDIVRSAEEKRQFLCNYINYIDSDEDMWTSKYSEENR